MTLIKTQNTIQRCEKKVAIPLGTRFVAAITFAMSCGKVVLAMQFALQRMNVCEEHTS